MVLPSDILNIVYKKRNELHYQDLQEEYYKKVIYCRIFCFKIRKSNFCKMCKQRFCKKCHFHHCLKQRDCKYFGRDSSKCFDCLVTLCDKNKLFNKVNIQMTKLLFIEILLIYIFQRKIGVNLNFFEGCGSIFSLFLSNKFIFNKINNKNISENKWYFLSSLSYLVGLYYSMKISDCIFDILFFNKFKFLT